jgi:DNA-binding NarL/FixJ family response regulator
MKIKETVELLQSLARILVVDDLELWHTFVHMHLKKEPNLKVIGFATDGPGAVRKAEELQPDVILLDIRLPKFDGLEAARQIAKVAPKSKILFLSEEADPGVVQAAFSAGGFGYVLKSDARRDLLAGIESVLLGRQFVSRRLLDLGDVT